MTEFVLETVTALTGTPPETWLPLAQLGSMTVAVAALLFGVLVAVVEIRRA